MSQSGLMAKYRITRESLLDGSHHARIRAGQGSHVRYMTDEERGSPERYVPGLDAETVARYLATGSGLTGSCREYLFDTAEHLRELGRRDRRMEALARRVRNLRPHEEPPSP